MTGEARVLAFDCHVHAGPAEAGDALAPPSMDRLASLLDRAGTARAVVFAQNRRDGYRAANEEVLRAAAAAPVRWVPFLRMKSGRPHPYGRRARVQSVLGLQAGADEYGVAELATALGSGGFQGVKLNLALDGMPCAEAIELLARSRTPVLLHAGEGIDAREVEREFLRRGVPTVLAHMGTYPLRRRESSKWLALLDRYPNAYVDTAAVFFGHVIEEACRRFPRRVLFGTDAPAFDPLVGRAALDAIDLDPETRERVLAGNVRDLLGARVAEVRA